MDDIQKISGAEAANESGTEVDDAAYDVDATTAARLLGVGTTRLSQLTTRGSLSFERRKVGFRHRLFYRKAEILAYLAQQFPSSAQQNSSFETRISHTLNAHDVDRSVPHNQEQPEPSVSQAPPNIDFSPLLMAIKESRKVLEKNSTKGSSLNPVKVSARDLREKKEIQEHLSAVQQQLTSFESLFHRLESKLDCLQRSLHTLHASPQKMPLPKASALQREPVQPPLPERERSKWPLTTTLKTKSKVRPLKHR
jgi:hypothetical protein